MFALITESAGDLYDRTLGGIAESLKMEEPFHERTISEETEQSELVLTMDILLFSLEG